jgi:hypothetical protein
MWSDPDLKPYMAVTAHWVESVQSKGTQKKKLTLRADLIGFVHVPGSHTGDRLAQVFYFIINRMGLVKKVISSLIINVYLTFSFKDWLGDDRQCIQQFYHDDCLRSSDKS